MLRVRRVTGVLAGRVGMGLLRVVLRVARLCLRLRLAKALRLRLPLLPTLPDMRRSQSLRAAQLPLCVVIPPHTRIRQPMLRRRRPLLIRHLPGHRRVRRALRALLRLLPAHCPDTPAGVAAEEHGRGERLWAWAEG